MSHSIKGKVVELKALYDIQNGQESYIWEMRLEWVTEAGSWKAVNFMLKCLVFHSESDEDPLKDAKLENT